jgi:hypothetical protein
VTRADRCDTCGRPRGLEQRRKIFGLSPESGTVYIPRTDNPDDHPRQQSNDLICRVSVYRNGGVGDDSHLCNECLRVALRSIKVAVAEALGELDADHDKDAEIAALTARLATLQHKHWSVCFDHNRMQERLAELLASQAVAWPDTDVVRMAEWEVQRGKATA